MAQTALSLFAIFFSTSLAWGQAKQLVCAVEKSSSQKETEATPCTECLKNASGDSNQKDQTPKLPTLVKPDPIVDTFTEAQLDYFVKIFFNEEKLWDQPEALKLQINEHKKKLELFTKIENGGGPEAEKAYLETQKEKDLLYKKFLDPKTNAEDKKNIAKKYNEAGQTPTSTLYSLAITFKNNPSQFKSFKTHHESYIAKYQSRLTAIVEASKSSSNTLSIKRQTLRDLMKFHVQKLVDRPQFYDCGLTDFEMTSTILYTGLHYKRINSALRGNEEVQLEQLQPMIQAINSGLEKLARHEDTVIRTANLPPAVAQQHCLGCVVEYKSFTSASTRLLGFGYSKFLIKSKSGRYIAPLSSSPGEEEVLFKSGAKFRIVNVKPGMEPEYTMEEVTETISE